MGFLSTIFGGPFKDILDGVGGIIDKFVTTPEEKLKAQLALSQMANEFQLKSMELDKEWAIQQATVITAEAKSESWIAANWRPLTMLTFVFIIAYNYIISPIFDVTRLEIVPDMWQLLKIGLGGYIFGRTAEKVSADVVPAIIASKKK